MDATILQADRRWKPGTQTVEGFVTVAYATYAPEVSGHLRALLRDGSDAEDLLQEAFLRLHAETMAGRQPDNVRAWLHRVAVNLAMSRGRHLQVRSKVEPRLRDDDRGSSLDDVVVRRDEQRRLRVALGELGAGDREALLLAAAGFSGPEIAHEIGKSQVATRTLLCRARGRLRTLLAAADQQPATC